MKSHHQQQGFTLVELSIVLVIIGLIVSSVLVGQDLVRAAELRSTVTQYEDFNKAIGTFQLRHNNQLPGDISNATRYGYTGNGDGDGVLTDGTFTGFNNTDVRNINGGEYTTFWSHLGSNSRNGLSTGAGLIAGGYNGLILDGNPGIASNTSAINNLPQANSGEFWGVYSLNARHYFILGATDGATYTTIGALNPQDAQDIDVKVDDDRPDRGVIQARGPAGGDPETAATTGALTTCTNDVDVDGVNDYVLTNEALVCTLRFGIR